MGQRMRSGAWLGAVVLVVAACGSASAPSMGCADYAPTDAPLIMPTLGPEAFDLAAVKAHFTQECSTPVVDEQFCEQVEIAGMEAADTVLHVPTTLDPGARDRGGVICDQLAEAAVDSDLGYEIVVVWDKGGVGDVGDDNSVGSCFVI